jgi:hypothetical protein
LYDTLPNVTRVHILQTCQVEVENAGSPAVDRGFFVHRWLVGQGEMKLDEFFETPFEFGTLDAGSIVFSFAGL